MKLLRQPVAARGNRFWLVSGASTPCRFAADCHRLQPRGSFMLGIQNDSMRGRVHRSRAGWREPRSGVRLDDRERGAVRRGGDGDSAARFLLERDAYLVGRQLERFGDVVADPDGEGLAEDALVAEAAQVELERFRLEAKRSRPVLDRGDIEVGLAGDRADGGEFVAGHLDVRYAWIRERLHAGVVLRAGMAERHELGRTCACLDSRTL